MKRLVAMASAAMVMMFWASSVPIIEARPLALSPSARITSAMSAGYSSGQLTGTRVVHSVISWDALV